MWSLDYWPIWSGAFMILINNSVNNLCSFPGIAGSAVLKYITPEAKRGTLGATVPGPGVTAGQAVGVEILLTFLLVLTVCASTDPKRLHYGYEVPLSIGLCVAVCHFIGVSPKQIILIYFDTNTLSSLHAKVQQRFDCQGLFNPIKTIFKSCQSIYESGIIKSIKE